MLIRTGRTMTRRLFHHHAIVRSAEYVLINTRKQRLSSTSVSSIQSFFSSTKKEFVDTTSTSTHHRHYYSASTPVLKEVDQDHDVGGNNSPSQLNKLYPNHTLNIAYGLIKSYESFSFKELVNAPTIALQGIGPQSIDALTILGLHTILDMSNYKYYHIATTISTLASIEEIKEVAIAEGDEDKEEDSTKATSSGRFIDSTMNINKAIDKEYEHLTFHEILKLPIHAIQGISDTNETKLAAFKVLGVKTIDDLAKSKYFHWSIAIVTASKYEE